MCENNKRRTVEHAFAGVNHSSEDKVTVYDPEFFELKDKYDELCKAVLEYDGDWDNHDNTTYLKMYNLAKGETN